MKQQFDRYFELLPLVVVIVIVLVAEFHASSPRQSTGFVPGEPSMEAPRLIFR